MQIAHARVRHFRNLADAEVALPPGVCVLYGGNGEGKTNFLEALYILSNLRSFRTHVIEDLISWGCTNARIGASVRNKRSEHQFEIDIEPRRKYVTLDGKKPTSFSDYLCAYHAVLFSPIDLDLVRGSQDLRRRFLDRATFLADPTHLTKIRNYKRALRHRNEALRSSLRELEFWDEQLVEYGLPVHASRDTVGTELTSLIRDSYRQISGSTDSLDFSCEASYSEGPDARKVFRDTLRARTNSDARLGFTTVGPHRDVVRIRLQGRDVERWASQGQMRSTALALKVALLMWARLKHGEHPVFLLDDPAPELDGNRLKYLGQFLANWGGQVVLAATDKESVRFPLDATPVFFHVSNGRIDKCD